MTSRLSIVTGGPGTGKTATIRMICAAAAAQEATVLLVAPTGRAARRMTESTGQEASTVHAALGWVPGQGPTVDELVADVLIVDETSMANLELLVTLLRAVGPRTHVVLVGDADQLAPVGAGKPFAELVEAGAVPVTELTHIFRQAAGSMIVRGAHAVRQGGAPSFAAEEGLHPRPVPRRARRPGGGARRGRLAGQRAAPVHYGVDPVADIQVFAPVYRGALGIDVLNERLRARAEPGRAAGARRAPADRRQADALRAQPARPRADERHDPAAARARRGRRGADVSAEGARARAARGGGAAACGSPTHARCTAARASSCRWPSLIAHPAAGAFFLRREMLYTAMTRARQATVVVGTRAVVARAAATPDTSRRYGRLGERLAA